MNFRTLLIGIMLISTLPARSQCHRAVNTSVSLLSGVDRMGFTQTLEFGVWGVDQPVGAYAGFIMRNQQISGTERDKAYSYRQPVLQGLLRASYKVYEGEILYHVLTAYGTTGGALGASYRVYRPMGDHVVMGMETAMDTERQLSIQLAFTFNF